MTCEKSIASLAGRVQIGEGQAVMKWKSLACAVVLLSSAAAADDMGKVARPRLECEKRDPAKPRQPGLLKFEDLGVCQEAQRTPFPWENCGDCSFLQRWDGRLRIWRIPGR
jgi:hypothetical protein